MPLNVRYDVVRMQDDLAARGWQLSDLALRCGVAKSSVTRFLQGAHQTPRMAKKLSSGLGRSAAYYLIRSDRVVA